jgi:tripartite-type tricarboxylate transporter receptor subunit TctC
MRIWAAILVSAALLAAPLAGFTQSYPAKPVKVVIPYPPGSTPDIVGRTLSSKLQESLGQPFVVENRTGAGGNIGAEAVAKSPADGHTLLIGINGPAAINKFLYKGLNYDSDRDLMPVSLLATSPQMLVATPAVPASSFRDFIDHVRANPGRLSYGSVGSGSASHLTMELFKNDAKLFIVHIPYRGFPPAVTDMLAGNIDTMFAIIPAVLPQVRAGRMKALAVTGLRRSALAPEVPSVGELGYPQLESLAWIGLLAPAGTPQAVVGRVSQETMRSMQTADVRDSLGKQGFDVVASSPGDFASWIRSEQAKWSKVIKASGATAD